MALTTEAFVWTGEAAARLRKLRLQRGLSQKALGEPVVTPAFLSLVESGARHPSAKVLDHLSERLGVTVAELVEGERPVRAAELQLRLQEAREFIYAGRLSVAEAMVRDVATAATSHGLDRTEAKATEILASIEEKRDRTDAALELYQQAERLWDGEPLHLRYQAVVGVARCLKNGGEVRTAIHLLESYLLDLEAAGVPDPTATMRVNGALSTCYSDAGLPHRAARAAEKAFELAPRVKDPEQIACMNMNVARSLLEQGKDDEALEAIRNAELSFLALGWEIEAARAEINRGIILAEKGNTKDARVAFLHAVEILEEAGRGAAAGAALTELARLDRLEGRPAEAEKLLEKALARIPEGDVFERASNLRERGLCRVDQGEASGEADLLEAIDLFRLAGSSLEVGRTFRDLGDARRRSGAGDTSADAYRAGLEAIETAWVHDKPSS